LLPPDHRALEDRTGRAAGASRLWRRQVDEKSAAANAVHWATAVGRSTHRSGADIPSSTRLVDAGVDYAHTRSAYTDPACANIPCSTGLVDAGVDHAHTGSTDAGPACADIPGGTGLVDAGVDDAHAGSAYARGPYWALDTAFGYAHGLAINNSASRRNSKRKAQQSKRNPFIHHILHFVWNRSAPHLGPSTVAQLEPTSASETPTAGVGRLPANAILHVRAASRGLATDQARKN